MKVLAKIKWKIRYLSKPDVKYNMLVEMTCNISQMAVHITLKILPRSWDAHSRRLCSLSRECREPKGQTLCLSPSHLFAFSPWLIASAHWEQDREKASKCRRCDVSDTLNSLHSYSWNFPKKGTHPEDNSLVINTVLQNHELSGYVDI